MEGAPYRVMEFLHVKPGKGSAFIRTKLRNYITGNQLEKTFRAGETLEQAEVDKRDAQFTYQEGDDYIFMDSESYEESRVRRDDSWAKYLKEGQDALLVHWHDRVIGVDLPKVLDLKVERTDPNVKGNTASGGSKPATLETGAVIQVPLFIAVGEKIRVDTRENTYAGRATD
ncbi:hypothetical protein WJX73_001803 [Symbiochloris irregularis]|uniref:Elongation factor P n=1 Tax=Symbiochloris irregularis TaxID=706552 RepID=A0AAW1PYS3_9CHLO